MSSIDQNGRRLPPYSEEAERGVLGSALIEPPRVIELCSMKAVSADSFYIPAHRLLFEQVLDMYQRARAIDLLTVGEDLKVNGKLDQIGGYAFLEGLIDSTPTSAHAEYYMDIVQQKHLLRRIISQAAETIDRCYSPDEAEEAEELLSRTEEAFFELSDKKNLSAEDWKNVVYKTAGKIIEGTTIDDGVPTGFASLDKELRGLHNTDMIVLAARPSMGKTSLAMNIAEHAALGRGTRRKYAVGVFSLEMSQDQLVRRMLFSKAGVPAWKDFFSETDRTRLSSAADQLGKASIIVDDSAGLDIMDLRARARRMKRIYNVDLIVIDYLQLLHDKRRSREGRQQETASISNGIKAMAKELKIPILILSQLSRAPEQGTRDGKPRLSDLRDSGAIEQDADVVLLLQRPSYYNKEMEPGSGDDTLAIVDIAKHRNGPTGEVKLNFFRELTRFEDRETRYDDVGAGISID
ncbi:MAG: replicative helicase [Verrucomicrobiota bacterium]|jgi:replicative DNA helicase|nr:replicative helicase [Verrucomicrobiota bacterium]MDK2963086.1 replicative helicase [Verrucomicrobiota bacterium]